MVVLISLQEGRGKEMGLDACMFVSTYPTLPYLDQCSRYQYVVHSPYLRFDPVLHQSARNNKGIGARDLESVLPTYLPKLTYPPDYMFYSTTRHYAFRSLGVARLSSLWMSTGLGAIDL